MAKADVLFRFGADTSDLDAANKRITSDFQTLKGFAGVAIGAFSANAIYDQIRSTTEWADTLANTADRVGQTTEAVQALRLEGEKYGLSTQAVDTALQRFARRLSEAQKGTGVLKDTLKEMRIGLRNVDGTFKTTAQVLDEYALGLQKTANASDKARLSMSGFDTDGVKLGQAMGSLSGDVSALTKRMIELDRVIGDDSVRSAAALETAWTELTQTMASKAKGATLDVIDFFDSMFVQLRYGADQVAAEVGQSAADVEISRLEARIAQLESLANDITPLSESEIANLDKMRAALKLLREERERAASTLPPIDVVGGDDEQGNAAKKTTATKRKEGAKQVSDTRATAQAEGAYWQAEHDLIASLQDDNATAVENARARMRQAIADMEAASASDFRVKYYEEREKVSDLDVVPKVTFSPVVDPNGLADMGLKIQEALDHETFTVVVQPILSDSGTATIDRTAAQEGHDET